MHFYEFFNHFYYTLLSLYCSWANRDFVSSLVTLILIERHRSQNKGSLKSEERLSDFKELCTQLCRMDDEGIEADTDSWSSRYGQKVAPIHYIPVWCTGTTFCPYWLISAILIGLNSLCCSIFFDDIKKTLPIFIPLIIFGALQSFCCYVHLACTLVWSILT